MLLYPGALAGSSGHRFEAMVKRGGPLGELVQWADLSACLTILGHSLTFSNSQQQLSRLAPQSDTTSYFHLTQYVIVIGKVLITSMLFDAEQLVV